MISRSEPGKRKVYRIFSALALMSSLATVCAGEFELVRPGEPLVMKLGLGGRSLSVPFEGRSPDPRSRDCCEPKLSWGE